MLGALGLPAGHAVFKERVGRQCITYARTSNQAYPTVMKRLNFLFTTLLAVCLIALAPQVDAQVPVEHHHDPPTQAEMVEMRTDLQNRLVQLDTRLAEFEAAVRELPQADRRRVQEHLEAIRVQRDEVEGDIQRLERVTAQEWTAQHQPIQERLARLEGALDVPDLTAIEYHHQDRVPRAGPPAAAVPRDDAPRAPAAQQMQQHRRDLDQRIQRLDQQMTAFEQRVQASPAAERQRMQQQLTQMRQERDRLRTDVRALEGVTAEQWAQRYEPVQQRLTGLERRLETGMAARTTVDRPQLTAADVREHRADLDQRMQRFEQDLPRLERQARAVADPQARADLEGRVADLRTRQEQMRRDVAGLEAVDPEHWPDRFRPVGERMAELEAEAHRVNLAAAPTQARYQTAAAQTLQAHRDRLGEMHRMMADLPREQRGEFAHELIQVRRAYDDVWREHERMQRVSPAIFQQRRTDFTDQLAQLETDIHMARLDMMAPAPVATR